MSVSYRSVVASLAVGAMLVIGVDYATFASTGDSLILGRTSTTQNTTTVVKNAPGPALVLKSRGNAKPSLRVTSRAKVPSLNADRLDGLHASSLASRATSFRVGRRGDVVPGVGVWSLDIRPGLYQASFTVLGSPDTPVGETGTLLCGVVDLKTLGENTRVYTAQSGSAINDDSGSPIAVSGTEMVRIRPTASPGLYCGANTPEFTLYSGVVSMTSITSRNVKTAHPEPVPFRAKGSVTLSR